MSILVNWVLSGLVPFFTIFKNKAHVFRYINH